MITYIHAYIHTYIHTYIPMAVETFVTSLGIDLTDDQRTQLHGLLKRPNKDDEDINKRRKTETTPTLPGTQCG